MKLRARILSILLVLTFVVPVIVSRARGQSKQERSAKETLGLVRQREKWFYGPREYPLGYIPAGARLKALGQMRRALRKLKELKSTAAAGESFPALTTSVANSVALSQTNWTLIGPQPTLPPTGDPYAGFPTESGRVTALAFDPRDTTDQTIYLGSAEGGLWTTTNGGQKWTPLTDSQPSLAIGSIALDPTTNPTTIYIGTGEANFNGDAYFGAGVLKSTDGGNSWTEDKTFSQANSSTASGPSIGALAVDPSNNRILLAGVTNFSGLPISGGIWRSTDAGSSWTPVLTQTGSAQGAGTAVVFDPSVAGVAYAALGSIYAGLQEGNGIYKSTDDGNTWTPLSIPGVAASIIGRVSLAIGPPTTSGQPGELLVAIADNSSGSAILLGLWLSTDGGNSWTQLTSVPDFCDGQCAYDMAVAIDPQNPSVLYAGGTNDFGGQALTVSTDGGGTWSADLYAGGSASTTSGQLHTDTHAVVFSPDGSLLAVGNDGGVWTTANPSTASSVSWNGLNDSLAITQFYPGLSIFPGNPNVEIGGTQDNGTQTFSGNWEWNQIAPCGDGSYTAFSSSGSAEYAACAAGEGIWMNLGSGWQWAGNGIGNCGSQYTSFCYSGPFVPPLVIDPENSSILYFTAQAPSSQAQLVYQTIDGATSWQPMSFDFSSWGTVMSIAVAPSSSNVVYAGTSHGGLFVTTNATAGAGASWQEIDSGLPARAVTDVAVDPASPTTAFVSFSGFSGCSACDQLGHIYETTNGGTTWTNITGDLPDIPVNALVVDPLLPNTIYAATDVGVYATSDGGTDWLPLASGLPSVAVMGLTLDEPSRTLVAATHGRSAWALSLGVPVPNLLSPANGTTLPAGTTSETLSWSSLTRASYGVQVSTGGCGQTFFAGISTQGTSWTVTGLSDGQTYYWQVDAVTGAGNSAYSSCYSFSVSSSSSGNISISWLTQPPSSVTAGQTFTAAWNILGTTATPTHINVHWDPTNPETGVSSTCVEDTTSCSTYSPTPDPTTLTAPTNNTDGTAITVPTTVLYVVHAIINGVDYYSPQASVIVNPSSQTSPTITLAASPTTANLGQTVSLTAAFSGANSGAPTGPAYFYDDFSGTATELGTSSFSPGSSSGQYVASFSTSSLLAGTHAISVIYDGDSNYKSAISNLVDVTVQQGSQGSLVLSSLVLNPATVVGGFPSYGTATLTGNAPSGGAVVSLTSNNTHFVTVPSTVTVTPGYNNVVFPITTQFTGGTTTATITASYNGTTYGATLTVLPVAVSGVTFYPSSVTAGDAAPLTVYLTGPAPAGTSVTFTNPNPSVLQLLSSVVVPTGATSVSVTGTTLSVGIQTTVTVTASYNNSSGQGSLTVVPAAPLTLNTFGVSPQTITGGASTTGTVWLTAPAPSGGVSVTLTNPSSLVQMPTSVQVAGGSASASFTIGTSTVAAVTNVLLTASYGGVSQNVTLTLVPPLPYLASVTMSPSTVDGGSTSTGTVALTAPAPVGGIAVNLTNQNGYSAIANVPTAALIAAGATTGTFSVTTSPTAFIVPVEITASYNGTSQSTTLTVVPPGTPLAPSSLSLNPVSVTGGSNSAGTVTLTEPAPSGGAVISLASDNPDVVVPPTVTVPEGEASTIFTATTSSVADVTTATVTASLNGISQSSLLTVEPSGTPTAGNPLPFVASPLVPLSHTPSSTDLALTVKGAGFVPGSQILWNGTALPTTVVSNSELQTSVPAANVKTNGSSRVTVLNPGSGTSQSNRLYEHLTYPTSAPSFSSSLLSLTGGSFGIATGDFNGDGHLDLAVGKQDGSGVSIFLGNGDGTFGPERIIPAISSSAIVVGDFNGDGKLDIAFVKSNSVGVALGNGDGTFTAMPDVQLPSTPGSWASIAVGDFNGDGNLDLVVTGDNLTGAYVLLGKGDGTFGAPTLVGSVNQPTSVAVADFNGDGNLDIALTDNSGQAVAILLGNGNGTFQAQQEYPTNGYSNGLAVGDFDGDGHPDIAVSNGGPVGSAGAGIAILHNNGNGTFAAPVTYGAGQVFDYLAVDDVNGDGNLDLVTTANQPSPQALIFLGNGAGTFSTSPVSVSLPATAPPTIADINNDGASDILVPDLAGSAGLTLLQQVVAPILAASPTSLSFTAVQGGSAPASATLSISNTGGGTVSWSASASQPWLSLDQTSGTAPSIVSVTANPSGLAAGTYTATITLTDAGAANSPQTISVSFTVNPTPISVGSLAFNPTALAGPGSATGTVTLSSAAPAGGATVTLSSDNSAVTVPSTTTVAAGANSGTFTATASTVSTQTVATITATYSGVSTTAKLTVNPSAPVVGISPTSLTFANEVVGQTSAPQNVTVTNTGTASLNFSSIAATGDFSVQSTGTTCSTSSSLAVNSNCTIAVTFTPTASGSRTGTLGITDNAAGSPQTVTLTGTGTSAAVSLSATSETFPGEVVNTASPQQSLTLKNTGSAALTVSGISIGGANAGDFGQTNNCGSSLAAGASCAINITFKPTAAGARTGALSISDNATGSPQTVALSGTGEDFTLGVASGGSSTDTVTAGGTATYSLSVAPEGGFNQAVSIACTGAPSLATCTASPTSVTPDGTNPASVSITVSTTAASAVPPSPSPEVPLGGERFFLLALGLLLLVLLGIFAPRPRRRAWLTLALTLVLIGVSAACGGGGPSSTTGTGGGGHTAGTPTGTYSLTVSGSDGSLTHSTTLTLTVQ